MVNEAADQRRVEKQAIIIAIEAINAKGWDVNPFTVADEAKIERALVYRNTEFMDLIVKARGNSILIDVEATEELEKRVQELETRVRQLQIQNEVLTMQQQQQYDLGHKLGIIEGRKQAQQAAAPPKPQEPASMEALPATTLDTGEMPKAPPPVQKAAASIAQDVAGELSGSFAALPVITEEEAKAPPVKGPGTSGVIVQQAPFSPPADEWETPDVPSEDHFAEPALEPVEEPQPYAAQTMPVANSVGDMGFEDSYSERMFNAARSGPFVASEFNPLIELSWKDLETVYHFRARTLKDISKNYPGSTGQNMPAMAPQAQVANPPQAPLSTLPQDEGQETAGVDPAPRSEPAGSNGHPRSAQYDEPEPVSTAQTTGEYLSYRDSAATDQESALVDALALGESLTQIEEAQNDPTPEAEFDPSEQGFDLESLDIFEGLDDYGNLEDIEIIQDVQLKDGKAGPSDDELRDLIKNRIRQAREGGIPEPAKEPSIAGQSAAAGKEADAAKGLKSKFVGSKAAAGKPGAPESGQVAQPAAAQPGAFASRNIPPEIRKACLILGVRPEEMTMETVQDAWKRQIASPGVHPDLGGDTESAIYLNTAKDTLLRWLEQQAPKLGKKFGGGGAPKPGPKGPEK